jgi:hypothetical protein
MGVELSAFFFFCSLDLSLVYEVVELAVLYEKNTRLYHLSGLLAGLLIHAWTRRRQAWPSAGKPARLLHLRSSRQWSEIRIRKLFR